MLILPVTVMEDTGKAIEGNILNFNQMTHEFYFTIGAQLNVDVFSRAPNQ